MTVWIVVGIIALLAIIIVSMYNTLVKLRNNRENAFADIDVQLKQRHDLVPQLVETVKGYAAHEKETLDRVVSARNGAINAKSIDDKIVAENALSSALAGLARLMGHKAMTVCMVIANRLAKEANANYKNSIDSLIQRVLDRI